MINFDVMKQKIQQMDIDEAAKWFSENCDCPLNINNCPEETWLDLSVTDRDWVCTMCWKKWFEESADD